MRFACLALLGRSLILVKACEKEIPVGNTTIIIHTLSSSIPSIHWNSTRWITPHPIRKNAQNTLPHLDFAADWWFCTLHPPFGAPPMPSCHCAVVVLIPSAAFPVLLLRGMFYVYHLSCHCWTNSSCMPTSRFLIWVLRDVLHRSFITTVRAVYTMYAVTSGVQYYCTYYWKKYVQYPYGNCSTPPGRKMKKWFW